MRKGYLIGTIIVVIILLAVGIWYITLPKCFSQQLYANGDGNDEDPTKNEVVIPSCFVEETTDITTLLEPYPKIRSVFYYTGSAWTSWLRNEPANSLSDFTAGETYYFYVNEDFLFEVE